MCVKWRLKSVYVHESVFKGRLFSCGIYFLKVHTLGNWHHDQGDTRATNCDSGFTRLCVCVEALKRHPIFPYSADIIKFSGPFRRRSAYFHITHVLNMRKENIYNKIAWT